MSKNLKQKAGQRGASVRVQVGEIYLLTIAKSFYMVKRSLPVNQTCDRANADYLASLESPNIKADLQYQVNRHRSIYI